MRIELQESTIINAITGEKICDISELSDYGQAMYIIELLMKDRQKAEEDYLEILEENRLLKLDNSLLEEDYLEILEGNRLLGLDNSLLEEEVSELEYRLNEVESEFQMFRDSLDEWSRDYDRW